MNEGRNHHIENQRRRRREENIRKRARSVPLRQTLERNSVSVFISFIYLFKSLFFFTYLFKSLITFFNNDNNKF
jgi:hypothetical protein